MSFLTESEQEFILEVLRRDEELRRLEELRVKKLKAELLEIRRKGAKRGSGKYSERSCGRCQEPMGLLTRNGSQCRVCKHHVCKKMSICSTQRILDVHSVCQRDRSEDEHRRLVL